MIQVMYPSMCQEVVPCGEVRKALTTQECDANEVMAQFQQCLSLRTCHWKLAKNGEKLLPQVQQVN